MHAAVLKKVSSLRDTSDKSGMHVFRLFSSVYVFQ